MDNILIKYLQRFATIPLADIPVIIKAFSVNSYKPGVLLLSAGQNITKLYFIERGLIKLVVPRAENKSFVFSFVEDCQVIGLLYLYNSFDHNPHDLKTVTETIVWTLDLQIFEDLCIRFGYLKCAVIEAAKTSIAESIISRSAYLGLSAYQKYQKIIQLQRNVVIHAPLQDIASYLEITPQSFSRVRRNIKD